MLNLRRLLSVRLAYRISDSTRSSIYREFVERVRIYEQDLMITDSQNPRKGKENDGTTLTAGSASRGGRGSGNGRQNTTTASTTSSNKSSSSVLRNTNYKGKGPYLPPHIQTRLRNKGRYFKYIKTGHLSSDMDAPYKNSPPLTSQQATAQLSAIGIDLVANTPSDSEN